MSLYLLFGVIFFAFISTFLLWFRVYNLDREQGLLTLLICFPILPFVAWTHKEKCKPQLTAWIISMLMLIISVVWLSI